MKTLSIILFFSLPMAAQNMSVKIVQRHTGETNYTFQVAGQASSTSHGSADCSGNNSGGAVNVDCSTTGTTETTYTAPAVHS